MQERQLKGVLDQVFSLSEGWFHVVSGRVSGPFPAVHDAVRSFLGRREDELEGALDVVWPRKGKMTASRIVILFSDAVANRQIACEHLGSRTTREMAEALDDAGIITLGKVN
jgi:hypothetical protein